MAGEYTPLVSGRFRNLLCGTFSEGNKTWTQSELLGSVGRIQILGSEGSSLAQRPRAGRMLLCLLYLFTAVTRLVDAVSYIGLVHVFTANITGNVVCLVFRFCVNAG